MRALIRQEGGRLELRGDLPVPQAAPGEVVVRVEVAGICRTDLYAAHGQIEVAAPVVLGHEFCGRIHEVGAGVEGLAVGDRVSALPLVGCGACTACRGGDRGHCDRPTMIGVGRDGAFADHVALPAPLVHRVPQGGDPARWVFFEPVMACGAPIVAIEEAGAARVLVYGEGRIAALVREVVQALAAASVEVAVLGPADEIEEGGWDVVVETRAEALSACMRALRPGGTLVLKSRPPGPVSFDLHRAVRKELRLIGAHYLDRARAPQVIGMMQEGRLSLDALLGPWHPIERWEEAFAAAMQDEAAKHLLVLDESAQQ